ncbi:peptidase MA family metallohydrolase [Dethiothermospora halolimnae]|uniref:peptidase MA family metallohydrolase n=1 Tax=Dethiothermospora halolimnae TaxID=3114390 RepID=UPI003CCB98E4
MKKNLKPDKKSVAILMALLFMFLIVLPTLSNPFHSLVKFIEKKRIIRSVKDYETLETDRLIIKYEKGNRDNAILTRDINEKYYNKISKMFNYDSKKKINIIIYSDGDKLLKNTRLKKGIPPLGVYYGGIINILSPEKWIKNKEEYKSIYEIKGPIVHEFVHLIIDEKTNGNYPIWLTEGMALYTEYLTTGFEWNGGMTEQGDITIKELNNNFHNIDQRVSYRKSFEIVKAISDKWGIDKLNMILDNLGKGENIKNTTKAVLKIDLYDIEKQ